MNEEVSFWMRDTSESSDNFAFPFIATRGYDSVISSILEETLEALGAKGMVVGHTPQFGGVNSKYNDRIWCIDVGMSKGVLDSRPEVNIT
ncbi:hypothetical protein ZIOFF_050804 [Zingiber officinale]|uniref:Uncharacterized protein n=1 Tax=Zingiber officinale TaxID=94328 RepID=A0A8J5FRL0_ZINOF|nr:hypothetical protein ZIOFF_050804 [Zingiber officinale]